jgi:GT2 family glycosyltransferase
VIPTADRPQALAACLATVGGQTQLPADVIVVDASNGPESREVCAAASKRFAGLVVRRVEARARGAAVQRAEGLEHASQPFILFMDDDVELEPTCVERLWSAIRSEPRIGGVSSMLVNQQYAPPGRLNRWVYRIAAGGPVESPAGRCLGPAVTVFPADRSDLPEVVSVEWLNTTCTLYRRDALPSPVFPPHFTGYSLGEDVNLSLVVGRRWKLVNARTARVLHRSGGGPHKPDRFTLARMSTVNRHYIMTHTLGRRSLRDHLRFALVESADVIGTLKSFGTLRHTPAVIAGKLSGIVELVFSR